MFFPERIANIKHGDNVLEIGPGRAPHARSNVLLEKRYFSHEEFNNQCGESGLVINDERTVYYDGGLFPFVDKSFDYVICSHVIEHVENVEQFCSEMFRVAKSGYLEYPLVYYEYLYNFDVHVNILKYNNNTLFHSKKNNILHANNKEICKFWLQSLNAGYSDTVSHLVPLLMEGFEWLEPFPVRNTDQIQELCHQNLIIPPKIAPQYGLRRKIFNRIKSLLIKLI